MYLETCRRDNRLSLALCAVALKNSLDFRDRGRGTAGPGLNRDLEPTALSLEEAAYRPLVDTARSYPTQLPDLDRGLLATDNGCGQAALIYGEGPALILQAQI